MSDEIMISINTKQPHTQSPGAITDYIDSPGWVDDAGIVHQQVSHSAKVDVPSMLVIYHAGLVQTTAWQMKFVYLSKLQDGWNGYNAPAPSEKAIGTAKSFVDALLREKYGPKRLAASAVGGVAVTQRNRQRKVYVEFFNDGTVFALFSDGSSEPISKEIIPGYQSFKALVKEMRDYLHD